MKSHLFFWWEKQLNWYLQQLVYFTHEILTVYVCSANVERDSRTNPIQLFVHPPGLQLAWLLRSLSVGMSEGLWAPPSRNGCACDTSLSILCRLSSARSLSNSNLRIFSWRLFSAERIAGSKHCIRWINGAILHSAQNKEQQLRRGAWMVDGGRWRWTNDGRRCSRDTQVVWHHVAHAVAMVQRTTAIPKRKLPRMHTSTGALDWKSPALLVSGSALLGNAGGWDRRTRVCGVLTKGWWAGYSWYDERDRLPDTTPLDRAAGGWERAWRDTSHTKHGWIWKVKRHLA